MTEAKVEIVKTVFTSIYRRWVFLLFLNVATLYTVLCRRNHDVIGHSLSDRKRASDEKDEDARTRILLMTTFLFLIIFLPHYVIACRFSFPKTKKTRTEIGIPRIHCRISGIMSNVNHAANFYMYLIPSRKFRKNLIDIFRFPY
jgi:hypothetical protein